MQKYKFQGNKKEEVLGNLVEKIDKCPTVELGPDIHLRKKNYEMIKI